MWRFVMVLGLLLMGESHGFALEPIPDKLVVLTFDDSSKSHVDVAAPLLKRHGFGATFFVTEGFDMPTNKRDYMTWEEIARLHRDGFEIGNHTRDHKPPDAKDEAGTIAQLEAINAKCAEHGIPRPVSFAYPGNALDRDVLRILKRQGIKFARRGGAPEYPYDRGRGFAYEPGLDHPLLIPSAGDARPKWTLDDFKEAVAQAKGGKIAVIQLHGVPDTAHSWVNTPAPLFEQYVKYLAENKFKVIALRDLAKYVDPEIEPKDPWKVVEDRKKRLAVEALGESGFVDSGGVKIHYMTAGKGPLMIMIHGFPDFWYTWRAQIPELSKKYQVVAIDQRGYNLSDKPEGVENYTVEKLVGDVVAVIKHFGREKATIVGHDWGGMVAWSLAMSRPELVERLVILNLPHPRGLMRELANNPAQQQASQYARNFQQPDAAKKVFPAMLAFWVKDPEARKLYVEAFQRSSIEGMLNYYKANYPREPYRERPAADFPQVKCPVLMIHGLKDVALLPGAINDTWKWIDNEFTLVTIPGASHFVQQDAPERVTRIMVDWLAR